MHGLAGVVVCAVGCHSYRYAMSTVLRPTGPQGAGVYWRRRAIVLLGLLAVISLLGFLLFGGRGGQEQAATPEPSQTPTAEPSPSASPSASPGAEAEPAACSELDVQVLASTDANTYAAGVNPKLTLTIANTSDSDCARDIGSGANEIIVTSGGQHVWSSDDCDPSQSRNEQVIPAGAKAVVELEWERKLSAPGCTGSAEPAKPGAYQVQTRNGKSLSEPVRIELQ